MSDTNVRAWNAPIWTCHISEIWSACFKRHDQRTDKLIPEIKLWQHTAPGASYPFVWLDAIHYKVKQDGRYAAQAVYTVLGLNLEAGRKFLACIYLKPKVQSVLTDLNNRGLQDILIACVDGLTGFPDDQRIFQMKSSFVSSTKSAIL